MLVGLACSAPAVDEIRNAEGSEEAVAEESTQYDAGLEPLVTMAKEDLAERQEVEVEVIEVLEAELVVWPDASMGCPDPEMMYAQVMQEGTLIRLDAGGGVFEYHSGADQKPVLCGAPILPVTSSRDSTSESR